MSLWVAGWPLTASLGPSNTGESNNEVSHHGPGLLEPWPMQARRDSSRVGIAAELAH